MTPIDVAEKWARAARVLYFEGRDASDPLAITLDTRTRAHYGEAYEHSLESITAVAMLEAMNEWEHVREAPTCTICHTPIMPTQEHVTVNMGIMNAHQLTGEWWVSISHNGWRGKWHRVDNERSTLQFVSSRCGMVGPCAYPRNGVEFVPKRPTSTPAWFCELPACQE
jgi:hypothetical protein